MKYYNSVIGKMVQIYKRKDRLFFAVKTIHKWDIMNWDEDAIKYMQVNPEGQKMIPLPIEDKIDIIKLIFEKGSL